MSKPKLFAMSLPLRLRAGVANPSNRRTLALAVVVGTALALTAGAVISRDEAPRAGAAGIAGSPRAETPIATAVVQLRRVTEQYSADAVIEAVHAATVSAQINGTLVQWYVDAGDRVKRGQLLARLDPRDTDALLLAGQANVAQAEAALEQARLNHERTVRLVEQKFISQSALDKAAADYKAALAALEVARAGRTQATTARSFAELRAPIDGVISRRLLEVGELAAPGKPAVELFDPASLRAAGSVPQSVLARLGALHARERGGERAGERVTVLLPTLNASIESTALTVLPAADPRRLSTEVRAELPARLPAGAVPGTVAKILIPTGAADKLLMPADALVRRGEFAGAYVIDAQGRSSLRQLRVGETIDGRAIEVLAGLSEGERVALNPLIATR